MFLDFSIIQNNIVGQFLLPFALLFAVVFGSLRTAGVFEDKGVNTIIAAAIAFIASLNPSISSGMFQLMPALIVILGILFLYNLVSKLLGIGKEATGAAGQPTRAKTGNDVLFIVGTVLLIVGVAGRDFIPDLGAIDQTNLIFIIALLGIFVLWKKGVEETKQTPG